MKNWRIYVYPLTMVAIAIAGAAAMMVYARYYAPLEFSLPAADAELCEAEGGCTAASRIDLQRAMINGAHYGYAAGRAAKCDKAGSI